MVGSSYKFRLTFLALVAALPLIAIAAPTISGMSVEVGDDGAEQVAITGTAPLSPKKSFTLDNPDRLVVDFPNTAGSLKLPSNYKGNLLKSARFGQFNPTTSRLVIDLAVPVTVKSITPGSPLVIQLVPNGPLPATASNNAEKQNDDERAATGRQGSWQTSTQPIDPKQVAPVSASATTGATANSRIQSKADAKAEAKSDHGAVPSTAARKDGKAVASAPAAKSAVSEKDKPLIAIDAGHGGQDPGAIGVHDTHERDVTLNFALNLRKALLRTGRYRVALTRDNDTFVMLHDRVDIARRAHADMLVSLHADSNPLVNARGLSIYTLSATASDDEAAALAERENKADVITGINLNTTDQDVANILIDLTQRETMNKSTELADDIVANLHPKIQRLPSTHRFAGFRVLKAPDVPSVLIELGFLSNPIDERLLLSPEYRDIVVGSVIKGIDQYYAEQ